MTVFFHELRRNRLALIIWSAVIAFMLGVCVLIYPEMSSQMEELSAMFSDMGSFSAAFGMDQLNFGEFMGYFGIECGNTLGLGGAFFAAILGISALAKEEKEHTAEFLLAHPISRARILSEKLCAIGAQILLLNLAIVAVVGVSILIIDESVDLAAFVLLFLSYLILQLEIAAITFGISSLHAGSSLGIGIGIAFGFYFLNILSNLTEGLEFLKYITPFSYTDAATIIEEKSLSLSYLLPGILLAALGIGFAYWHYSKKDIA